MPDVSSPSITIRVLLADDHDILRQGLKLLLGLQPEISIVGEARTGQEAVQLAMTLKPNVVVMDISMPDMDGMEACQHIRTQQPATQVLMLTMHESEEYFLRSLRMGATGYLVKKAAPTELSEAISTIAHGGAFLYPGLAKALIRAYVAHPSTFKKGESEAGVQGTPSPDEGMSGITFEGPPDTSPFSGVGRSQAGAQGTPSPDGSLGVSPNNPTFSGVGRSEAGVQGTPSPDGSLGVSPNNPLIGGVGQSESMHRSQEFRALTPRELEVLTLVAEGRTNQEIADQLVLSIKTVQAHRANVMEKLGLHDVTHLVRFAIRHGLIPVEP